jgi:hypothetical protein
MRLAGAASPSQVVEERVGVAPELIVGLRPVLDADPVVSKPHLHRRSHDEFGCV